MVDNSAIGYMFDGLDGDRILIERLEKKLNEKEKEIKELREFIDGKIADYVRAYMETVFEDVGNLLESRFKEMERAIRSLTEELIELKDRLNERKEDNPYVSEKNVTGNLLVRLKNVKNSDTNEEKSEGEYIIAECEHRSRSDPGNGGDLIICE